MRAPGSDLPIILDDVSVHACAVTILDRVSLALTPGGGRTGSVLSGSLNDQLADAAGRSATARLVSLHVGEVDASLAGLSCGGDARCLLVPATDLPGELWDQLRTRLPVCLVTRLDGELVVDTVMFTPETIADAGHIPHIEDEQAFLSILRARLALLIQR